MKALFKSGPTRPIARFPIGKRTVWLDGVPNRSERRRRGQKGGRKMALKKRGKTWHTHFFVDGQRFRQSLETSDWREAQKKEKELIARASQGKLATGAQQFIKLTFAEAAQKSLAERMD